MASSTKNLLEEAIGAENVLTGEAIADRYVHIWYMDVPLLSKIVLTPRSTNDVAAVMKICHQNDQPVVIHGGLTNLVGSTETNVDDIVVSLEKLNKIEEVDEMSRTITTQAGVRLEEIQNAAKGRGMLFPLNFGAKGTAHIGGAISTNAGGLRVFRFGMTRNLVLGIEAVLADGTIIPAMKKIIKDNSGYDIKQLFIGSEGTLGIVTKAILKLTEQPKSRSSAFVGFNSYEKVITFLKYMDSGLAGTLSGFELIWKDTYMSMTGEYAPVGPPLPYDYNYYVLIESLGGDAEGDHAVMEKLLGEALETELILDAVIANNESDLNWFWTIREDVHVLTQQCNNDQHFDISLPIPLIGKAIKEIHKKLAAVTDYEHAFTFGHVADGNIHLVVSKKSQSTKLINQINDIIYGELQPIGGSISAEHGIGVHKKGYLHYSRSQEEIALMKLLKRSMDPKNILNAGKVLDM